jgi:hypothetical protein
MSLRRRASALLGAATLSLGLIVALSTPGANAQPKAKPVTNAALINYLHTHGYLPLHGLATLQRAKAYAAAHAGQTFAAPASKTHAAAPTVGASWQGINDPSVSPPDTNGAIGPSSYIEIINLQIAIYTRGGTLTSAGTLSLLTGHSQFNLSDPMVIWDPDTQRFYYNVWDVSQSTMAWGFSKDSNPTTIPASFCNYTASFGYNPSTDIPDYPKLGQTKGFLLIGVNHYPSFSSMHADRSDVLWISKPQGQSPVTTCPTASTFTAGKFTNLKNSDGSQAFTPVPAIQTDPSATGFVTTMSDIECPDICGTGTKITVHAVRANPHNPAVPQLLTTGHSITVPGFTSPPNAPQKGTTNVLDTLDGRLTHSVSGIDPSHSNKLAVWVAHTVAGGAGSQINWYEINPLPVASPSLFQSGTVSSPSLYVFNAGISNDRMVVASGTGTHGDAMVLGFSTSSSSTFPAAQMVSKIGTGAQSAFVLVDQSATFDNDFTCTNATGNGCRWGDYGGATPDPAAPAGAHGEVWCTNEHVVTIGKSNGTWNWEAKP